MNCQQIGFLVAVFTCLQIAYGLQCWRCTSEYDVTCRDFFNITRINQNRRYFENVNYGSRQQPVRSDPHLEHCDEMYTSGSYGQKNVCLKRVYTATNGMKVVNRECRLVSSNLKPGYCPEELYEKNKNIDFCGTCDYDGCNSSNNLEQNKLLAILPAITLLWFLQK